jgi:hypothetical protein
MTRILIDGEPIDVTELSCNPDPPRIGSELKIEFHLNGLLRIQHTRERETVRITLYVRDVLYSGRFRLEATTLEPGTGRTYRYVSDDGVARVL